MILFQAQHCQLFFTFASMELLFITVFLLAICFAGIAVKILVKKNGKFSGTCASQNPLLNESGEPCSLCGKMPDEQDCKNPKAENAL